MKSIFSIAAVSLLFAGSALAEECILNADAPVMPADPATATEEDVSATIDEIKAYQGALAEYRECLDKIIANNEIEKTARKEALDAFNASVEVETKMVEDWQAFNSAYKDAQS